MRAANEQTLLDALSRREFLILGSTIATGMPAVAQDFGLHGLPPRIVFKLRRDFDLLDLELEFLHFREHNGWLEASEGGRAMVVVHFPPQNIAESMFADIVPSKDNVEYDKKRKEEREKFEKNGAKFDEFIVPFERKPLAAAQGLDNKPEPPIRTYMSGPSRIVFSAPDRVRLPLRLDPKSVSKKESVVDTWLRMMSTWPMKIAKEASLETFLPPRPPTMQETCLEIPYRLMISPSSSATRWLTTSDKMPFDIAGPALCGNKQPISELWNAALLSREYVEPAKLNEDLKKMAELAPDLAGLKEISLRAKAIYSPDYSSVKEPPYDSFYPPKLQLSLSRLTRHRLVAQMANKDEGGWIDVEHLIMTALGSDAFMAYFNPQSFDKIIAAQLAAKDPKDVPTTLLVWKHKIVVGRDVYFVEAYFGTLFPLVHPAVLVKVTRREFAVFGDDKTYSAPGAYLLYRYFIVVRQPDKQFVSSNSALGRMMPFKSAVLGMLKTPDLVEPGKWAIENDFENAKEKSGTEKLVFIPRALSNPNEPLYWPITFTDEKGRSATTNNAVLMFAANVLDGQATWGKVKKDHRTWRLPGKPLAIATEEAVVKLVYSEGPTPRPTPGGTGLNGGAWLAGEPALKELTLPFNDSEREIASRLGEGLKAWQGLQTEVKASKLQDLTTQLRSKPQETMQSLLFLHQMMSALESNWKDKASEGKKNVLKALSTYEGDINGYLSKSWEQVSKASAELNESVDVIRERVESKYKELQSLPQTLKTDSIKKLTEMFEVIGRQKEKADALFKNLHMQLRQMEQVSSILEATQVSFGSRLVNPLFDQVFMIGEVNGKLEEHVKKLREKCLDGAVKKMDDFVAGMRKAIEKLGSEIKADEAKKHFEEVKNTLLKELDFIKNESNNQLNLAKSYAQSLEQLAKDALNTGAHRFHAVMDTISGRIPSVKLMSPDHPAEQIKLMDDYVAKGIQHVANGMFGEVVRTIGEDKAKELAKQAQSTLQNGLAVPTAIVQGLSSQLGAMAADKVESLKNIAKQFDDAQAIEMPEMIPDAKIFGVIPLKKLIGVLLKDQMPTNALIKTPETLSHTWTWTIPVNADTPQSFFGLVEFENQKKPKKVCLNIQIVTTTKLPKPEEAVAGKRPSGRVRMDAYLGVWDDRAHRPDPPDPSSGGKPSVKDSAFSLTLVQMVVIGFRQLRIESEYALGESVKPKVKPEIALVDFIGPLSFVASFQESLGDLGGGFKLSLTPNHIELSYSFKVPDIAFGAFNMSNIFLGAGLMLPFGDKPLRFSFNFSTFKVPFTLAVMAFGGRGFFRAEIDTQGGKSLEGALEFGGALGFNVGVASGGLYVMAGIYFKIKETQTSLSGYLRAGGTLCVLGLIHASVEFLVMVTYSERKEERNVPAGMQIWMIKELYGTASLVVSIEMLFFSIDVRITMEKHIAGSEDQISGPQTTTPMPRPGPMGTLTNGERKSPGKRVRVAYFETGKGYLNGRYDWNPEDEAGSVSRWDAGYWSQFSLCQG